MGKWRLSPDGGTVLIGVLGVLCVSGPASADAMSQPLADRPEVAAAVGSPATPQPVVDSDRYTVLIDLDAKRLDFMQGDITLWSAPIGIGSDLRLISSAGDWTFSTPPGDYRVQFKEREPIWIAPDWFFVENDLPVPDWDHPSRQIPGGLGEAAIYLTPSIAIHGVEGPDLGFSHGCVRLENRFAKRLYHNVQVGTEVVIVGAERQPARVVDVRSGYDPTVAPRSRPPGRPDPMRIRWERLATEELLEELDAQLALVGSGPSRWDEVAIILLARARGADEEAVRGIVQRAIELPSLEMEREWATFLVDLFRRATIPTLEAISSLDRDGRRHAADLLVSAAVNLFTGDFASPGVPWPSLRLPPGSVHPGAEPGWVALLSAEEAHRTRGGANPVD
jgi:hypothetical protein